MSSIIKILIVAFLLIVTSCEAPPGAEIRYRITVENNTNHGVWYLVEYNYPDTSLPIVYDVERMIRPHNFIYHDSKKKWDKVFAEDIPGGKLMIFFIADSIKNNYSWEQIRDQYLILKRYDISYEELEAINYKVSYP